MPNLYCDSWTFQCRLYLKFSISIQFQIVHHLVHKLLDIKYDQNMISNSFLLFLCKNLLFCFQRMDLGECLKVHDLALRADYEIASKEQDFFFELDVCFIFELLLLCKTGGGRTGGRH